MTCHIYEHEPYQFVFSAAVEEVRGEWISLDQTAFYPGGGGQDPDTGVLNGQRVTEVKKENGKVLHRVPGHRLQVGDRVEGTVDAERRLDLMRGHTGEHLLFSCLSRQTELELVKIAITPEKKSVMVKGILDWDIVLRAEQEANGVIHAGMAVTDRLVSKDDPLLQNTRVKLDRIPGDLVRVVEIGTVDRAACAGIHVRSTADIGFLLVTKFVSARPAADYEVEFSVGAEAKHRAVELSSLAMRSAEALGSRPQDMLKALANLQETARRQEAALRRYCVNALANLTPSFIKGIRLYTGCFDYMDKKTLQDAANRIVGEGDACILGSVDQRLMIIVACPPDLKVDCVAVLNEALTVAGGRGGGKANFASGGAPSAEKADEVMVAALIALRKAIEASETK